MDLAQIIQNIKDISKVLEKLSKRLRRVEVLSRLAQVEQVDTFLDLADTPDSYEGMYGWVPKINNLENGLEFLPVGGGACVAFTCGPVAWRAVGGTDPRTLVHEEAFQLDADGDDRGAAAIDMQMNRSSANRVAGADWSVIVGGKENRIDPGADYCVAIGAWNWFISAGGNEPFDCHNLGSSHDTEGDSFQIISIGQAHQVTESNYVYFLGYNHLAEEAFGCYSLVEANDLVANVNEGPTYSGAIGILNEIVGDVFNCYQYGESNYMEGDGGGGADLIWMCLQVGFNNYISDQGSNVWQFGRSLASYLPVGLSGEYFSGRFIANGDNPQEGSTNTPSGKGFNQNSWFNQDTAINTWTVAWISSRFQFPIIEDSIWFFHAEIAGTELGCANSYAWKIEGVVENDGGTTTILTSTVTNIYRDVATKEWQVIADDPNDRLVFQFRDTAGPDATRCNIQFSMHTVEVGHEY